METNKSLHEKDQKYYLPTFKRYPIALKRGEGCQVWDVEDNEYLDVLAGIAVNNLGHCHPRVVDSLRDQAGKLIHISNFYVSPPQVELSQMLCDLSGMDRVFLTNSGAESVEGAIKVARKFAHSSGRGGEVISMTGSFHGRTLATIATGKKAMQEGFDPIPSGFKQVKFNDIESVKSAINKETAAIILEPIQGEGGVNPVEKQFLEEIRNICTEEGIVLIFDEIQCGIGRTGKLFAKEAFGVEPDMMTLAKGLGGGTPIGAFLCREKIAKAINFGDHGTTFGGNPLVCAAAIATLKVVKDEEFLAAVREKGEYLRGLIKGLNLPTVKEIRGKGLMIGVEFEMETKPLVAQMLKHRVLANATADNVLRLVPPLVITKDQIDKLVGVISKSLTEIEKVQNA